MGRSSRLALGAIAAAVAAGQIAPEPPWRGRRARARGGHAAVRGASRLGARASLPVVVGAGLIAVRLALVPAASPPLVEPPDGNGPWRLAVEATGSARDGSQTATLATPPDVERGFRVAATLPAYPAVVPGDRVTVDGSIRPRPDSPYGDYLLRIGAVGTLTARSLTIEPAPDSLGHRLELLRRGAAQALSRVLPEPEAGLAAGILIGLRDLVDRDLAGAFTTAGVSHVVAISGWNIAIVAAAIAAHDRAARTTPAFARDHRGHRHVHRLRGRLGIGRAGGPHGGRRPARARDRARRSGGRRARLGGRDPPRRRPRPDRRCRVPAVVPGHGRADRLGDPADSLDRPPRSRSRPGLAGREPRCLTRGPGRDAADHPRVVRSAGLLSPLVNLVVVPLVAPAMAAGLLALAGGTMVAAGAPPFVGAVVAAPGWVVLRILVTVVETAARLPFASVTLAPPVDVLAAGWRRRPGRGDLVAPPPSRRQPDRRPSRRP